MIKTHKPTVAFDIDGVLADFVGGFSRLAMTMGYCDEVMSGDDRDDWSFPFHVDPVWEKVDTTYTFWEALQPLVDDDDIAAMHALAQEAHVMYVTARSGDLQSTARQTHNWLNEWDFPEGPVFFVPAKSEKEGVILPNRYQLIGMLEDKPTILEMLASEGVPVVARDWPYNRSVPVPRVSSVAEFVERLGVQHTHVANIMPGWEAAYQWIEDVESDFSVQ